MLLQRFDKHTIQTFGFALIILGIILFMIGVFGIISFRTYIDCPTSGCPPYSLPAYYLLPVASFFSGIAFVVAGIILLIVARGMKPRETETRQNAQSVCR